MEIAELLKKVESSSVFVSWRPDNKEAYLANIFALFDVDKQPGEWSFGYYDARADRMTVFVVASDVTVNPPSEVFKKGDVVNRLDIDEVKVDFMDAMKTAGEFCRKNFSADAPQKFIVSLQKLVSNVWNISIITSTYKMVNIHVDSVSGKVVHSSATPLFKFMKSGL